MTTEFSNPNRQAEIIAAKQPKKAKKFERLGSLPNTIALGCCDIGKAVIGEGVTVYTTWGRNLTREQVGELMFKYNYNYIETPDGWYEFILPPQDVKPLLPLLRQ